MAHLINAVKERDKIKICKILQVNSPNFYDKNGYTPLIYACINNDIEISKLLLEYGAKVKIKNNSNITPMSCAFQHRNFDLLDLLLDYY